MMTPWRLSIVPVSIVPAPVLRSVALATGIVGLLAISGSDGLQSTGATARTDISAPSSSINHELAEEPQASLALQPSSVQADSATNDDLGQTHLQNQRDQNQVAMTEPSPAGAAADASMTVETAPINLPQAEHASPADQAPQAQDAPPTETAPAQVTMVNPQDLELGSELGAILRDAEKVLRNTGKAATSYDVSDECLVVEGCVDRYLWTLYQRTPKEDTLKTVEWRDVTVERKVKVKGKGKEKGKIETKMVTVAKAFTKLVEQDFGWKDPKAAEHAGMPMMEYVIGGMDRGFKSKLFHMLRAAQAAGLSPGITSGFRDDYRQSIASGLKAASNRSYHGGSLRGGYGHGLAADVVSVDGATRDQRFASSTKLWAWVDAHGKDFGIARPYLGRDPPHVAPMDGEEYAKHNRGTKLAAANAKKVDVKNVDAKKLEAKNTSIKQAASKAKDVSMKQAAAKPKKGDAKPNLVIMRDGAGPAKRVATRDDPRASKRVAVRDSARPLRRVTPRDAPRPANARGQRQAQR